MTKTYMQPVNQNDARTSPNEHQEEQGKPWKSNKPSYICYYIGDSKPKNTPFPHI